MQTGKSSRQQADIIRLLLLTGCRKSEIVLLRWSEVDNDRLVLADRKTGFNFPTGTVDAIQCHAMTN